VIAVAAALGLATTAPAPATDGDNLSTRLRQSAAAAQALQGPLDGAWTLRDRGQRALYRVQITDPGGGRPLSAVWRTAGPGPAAGAALEIARGRRGLWITLPADPERPAVVLRLRRRAPGPWVGRLTQGRESQRVTLARAPR